MKCRRRLLVGLLAVLGHGIAVAQTAAPRHDAASALLVVDAQVGVLASVWQAERVTANLQKLVAKARAAGAPVIWVQHADNELKYGSDRWQLAPGFVPAASESVVHKQYNSAFARTDLDARLKSLGVSRIVLAGAATNWCIRATAYAAVDRGYQLTLVGDAHSTEPIPVPGGKDIPAEAIVTDLNTVFEWLSVPDVRTEVRTTADVAF
ncbi:cysteine hydrolase family protein [Pelomonas cellulosilytica]|uniref:Cysteine hydrolase n=1 Tax=Pelomonas cellulosilytica TaxID=2906762 RepID=A0ABS8XVI3_9BURK|nr:cysteine hydrolase family protein [Pelomonas sp. P8]MCE4556667.1 cysteine hydrolase [Pelomonas sp. P8]